MKIMFIAGLDGWMGIHMRHFAAGFINLGYEVRLLDYRRMGRNRNPFARSAEARDALRRRSLEKAVKAFQPDLVIFVIAHLKFDFAWLKSFFRGAVLVYDMDGPGWKCYEQLDWIRNIDLLLTVSRVSQRMLRAEGVAAEYLAHGVDCNYYCPLELGRRDEEFFGAPLAFVGRPTARRVRMFSGIADRGLVLWGRRWSRAAECPSGILRKSQRSGKDIIGADVVKIYSGSDMMLNVLREPLDDPPTIMSLQVFLVPAAGTCLLTEWVEELEEAFEPGRELLTFTSEAEFREQVMKYSRDREALNKIGDNGRKRCLADHTHEKRAAKIIELIA
ncbi:MAG: glycosyltransferase [Victivallales bacterium]|nr:glycosyltransferase [Victivallales bacterium]